MASQRNNTEEEGKYLIVLPDNCDISDDETELDNSSEGDLVSVTTAESSSESEVEEEVSNVSSASGGSGRAGHQLRGTPRSTTLQSTPPRVAETEDCTVDAAIPKDYPPFHGQHGPKQTLPSDAEPTDFFNLLFSDDAVDLIVRETNRYAHQHGGDWDYDTDCVEIRAFIGMLFFIGIHRLPEMNDYFSSHWIMSVPSFSERFTKRRWWQLWSTIHLADNEANRPQAGEAGYDKLWKVSPLLCLLVNQFQNNFHIGQNVSVNEMTLKGKDQNSDHPTKPIKRGSKIWALGCSCCAYVFNMQVYSGRVSGSLEHGLAYRVVTDLCTPHLTPGNNHVLYLNSFFSSLPLSRHLESMGIYCVGTLRSDGEEYPPVLKDPALVRHLKRGEFHTAAVGSHIISVWRDTKVVSFISNVHPSRDRSSVKRKRKQNGTEAAVSSPPCVKDYNANLGPIARSDQMRRAYGIDRKSKRWWIRLFHFLLDVTMVNSYVLYTLWFKNQNHSRGQASKPLSQLQFRMGVIDGLAGKFSGRRLPGPRPGPSSLQQSGMRAKGHESVNLVKRGIMKSGRCAHCSLRVHGQLRKESSFGCATCLVRLCRDGCHDRYHQNLSQPLR